MSELSKKHEAVRDFILAYFARHGEQPSLKEIASECGLSNLMAAWRYRRKLIIAGELKFVVESPKTKTAGL